MKIDALDHPKTIDFAANLGVCMPQAIGHLELLWVFVGQKTPRGNIGRWSNAVIAHHAQWTGKPDDFVAALIAAGFVDEDDEYRLLIHDWEDHMPRWVKAKLSTQNEEVIRRVCINDCSHDDSQNDSADYRSDYSKDCSADSVSEVKGSEVKGSEVKGKEGKGPRAHAHGIPAKRKTPIPKDFKISDTVRQWAEEKGFDQLDEHLEAFVCKAEAKGYQYVNWDRAFQEAVRKDWAGLRAERQQRSTGTRSSDEFWGAYEAHEAQA